MATPQNKKSQAKKELEQRGCMATRLRHGRAPAGMLRKPPIAIAWRGVTVERSGRKKLPVRSIQNFVYLVGWSILSPLNSEAAHSTICVRFRQKPGLRRDISSTKSSMGASRTTGSP